MKWWQLDASCHKFQKKVKVDSGIICANFGHSCGRFKPWTSAWCGKWFIPHYLDCLEFKFPLDFMGASLPEVEDESIFKKSCPGDHLSTIFQWPNSHSQSIKGKDFTEYIEYEAFKCLVIRSNLDSFWSYSSKTIAKHLTEVCFMVRYANACGFEPCPTSGTFPLGHHLGMEDRKTLFNTTQQDRFVQLLQYYGMCLLCLVWTLLFWVPGSKEDTSPQSTQVSQSGIRCSIRGHLPEWVMWSVKIVQTPFRSWTNY